mgnify:CR=1 FL=1
MHLIEVRDVYKIYNPGENQVNALDGVSITIDEGEFVAIIGQSGSGKSTLIQHLNGLLEPHNGKVILDGEDIWTKENRKKIRQVRFAVGLCFQYPEYQIFEEDVYKEIAFGPKQMGLDDAQIDERIRKSMEFVGLSFEKYSKKSPFDLSGGQKRRVAIASIIAMEPKVLILDEPCAGLDPKGRDTILNLIKEYQSQMGNTVLFVSHSMEDVAKLCKKVIVMNKGEIAFCGSVNEVYSHGEELKEMGLNVPEVTDIFLKLKASGVDCKTDIYTVEQGVEEYKRLLGGAVD